jgi:hypothetical protein
VRSEGREDALERVVEHELIILPRVHGSRFRGGLERGDLWVADGGPGVQLEMVVEGDGLFAGVGDEGDADLDLEFTPPASKVSTSSRKKQS